MIVLKSLGAPVKRGRTLGRRKPSRAEAGADEVEPVSITQATVIRGQPLDDRSAAQEWLAACARAETAESEVGEALHLLNRAIQAHRVSAADPYTGDVSRAHARRVRIGYGTGDELVEGRWREALDLPPTAGRGRRRRMIGPEEQVAQILGGRRPVFPSEELLLRARLDLDQGRARQAALQAHAAQMALDAELATAHRPGELDELATIALERDLDDAQLEQLTELVVQMERVVRRRRHLVADG